ncbi:DUF5677 domain-containing protein [Paenibacillus sp. Soil750]|uniref:DUF5677 domain-containing protein n=1 Tax=Paenibacillus sp. Soil750 TaxID=1736398 RepID=UPI0006FD265E|nr:DUF5677 domain-containing protein [Paenibacillus sp. Soil750]KRE73912.1 hypothetical protein ASL11_06230 [Paenibacillus sp. Soil750]
MTETEEQNPLLDSLSQTILYADKLLEEVAENGGHSEKEVIIFALFRQLIEQVDGIFIGGDHNNLEVIRASVRNAFETNLAIEYIYQDPAQLTDRALSYKVGYINQDIEWFQMAIDERTLEPEVTEATLLTKKALLEAQLITPSLTHITNEWNTVKSALRRGIPKWYSLFGGPSTIFALAQRVNMENEYRTIYAGLSATAHGTTALTNATLEDATGRVLLWPLRDVDKTKEETPIILGRSFLLGMIAKLILNYHTHKAAEFAVFLDEWIEPTAS